MDRCLDEELTVPEGLAEGLTGVRAVLGSVFGPAMMGEIVVSLSDA